MEIRKLPGNFASDHSHSMVPPMVCWTAATTVASTAVMMDTSEAASRADQLDAGLAGKSADEMVVRMAAVWVGTRDGRGVAWTVGMWVYYVVGTRVAQKAET